MRNCKRNSTCRGNNTLDFTHTYIIRYAKRSVLVNMHRAATVDDQLNTISSLQFVWNKIGRRKQGRNSEKQPRLKSRLTFKNQ